MLGPSRAHYGAIRAEGIMAGAELEDTKETGSERCW